MLKFYFNFRKSENRKREERENRKRGERKTRKVNKKFY
jgi:hypothetical protein